MLWCMSWDSGKLHWNTHETMRMKKANNVLLLLRKQYWSHGSAAPPGIISRRGIAECGVHLSLEDVKVHCTAHVPGHAPMAGWEILPCQVSGTMSALLCSNKFSNPWVRSGILLLFSFAFSILVHLISFYLFIGHNRFHFPWVSVCPYHLPVYYWGRWPFAC